MRNGRRTDEFCADATECWSGDAEACTLDTLNSFDLNRRDEDTEYFDDK
jgi:hypothetical protein